MKAIAWAIFSVGNNAVAAYAEAGGHSGTSLGCALWAVIGFVALVAQRGPRDHRIR